MELGWPVCKNGAKNLLDADVQVPGFRRSEGSVEVLLNKYIPSLTIISGIIIGLLASVSDVLNVFGSGTGISANGQHHGKLLPDAGQRAGRHILAQSGGFTWQKVNVQ